MKNYTTNRNNKRFNLEKLREVDFSRFIDTRITESSDKRRTICPFHEEQTASFFIYPNNSYYCFGCGVHGNAIDFVMKKLGYSFQEACSVLEDLWQ